VRHWILALMALLVLGSSRSDASLVHLESILTRIAAQGRILRIDEGSRASAELRSFFRLGGVHFSDANEHLRLSTGDLAARLIRLERRLEFNAVLVPRRYRPLRLDRSFRTTAPTLIRIDQATAALTLLRQRGRPIQTAAALALRDLVQRDAFLNQSRLLQGWTSDWSRVNRVSLETLFERHLDAFRGAHGQGAWRSSATEVQRQFAVGIAEIQGRNPGSIIELNPPLEAAELLARNRSWTNTLGEYQGVSTRFFLPAPDTLRVLYSRPYAGEVLTSHVSLSPEWIHVKLDFGPYFVHDFPTAELEFWARSLLEAALQDADLLRSGDASARRIIRSAEATDRPILVFDGQDQGMIFQLPNHPVMTRVARRLIDYRMGLRLAP
jgi:hypothetical protein